MFPSQFKIKKQQFEIAKTDINQKYLKYLRWDKSNERNVESAQSKEK